MDNNLGLTKFKHLRAFWCQKVIPLVYDESLSYYEMLCKLMHRINQLIDAINEIIDILEDHEDRLTALETWKAIIDAWKTLIDNWKSEMDTWKGTVDDKLEDIEDDIESIEQDIIGIGQEIAGIESDITDLYQVKQDVLTAGENITIEDNVISASGELELLPATASRLGGVKVGSGLSVTSDGTLSATGGGSSLFIINMEDDLSGYECDKTFSEIETAYLSGSNIIVKYINGYGDHEWYKLETYDSTNLPKVFEFSNNLALPGGVKCSTFRIFSNDSITHTSKTVSGSGSAITTVLTGQIDTWTPSVAYEGGETFAYPSGYDKDNTAIVDLLWSNNGGTSWYSGNDTGVALSKAVTLNHTFAVGLGANNIAVSCLNLVNTETIDLKLVIMLLDD